MEAFGGNLPVAGGDPFTSRRLQNLKRTFEPWDFILPTSFFFLLFYTHRFVRSLSADHSCVISANSSCTGDDHVSRLSQVRVPILWLVQWHQEFCVFMSELKEHSGKFSCLPTDVCVLDPSADYFYSESEDELTMFSWFQISDIRLIVTSNGKMKFQFQFVLWCVQGRVDVWMK